MDADADALRDLQQRRRVRPIPVGMRHFVEDNESSERGNCFRSFSSLINRILKLGYEAAFLPVECSPVARVAEDLGPHGIERPVICTRRLVAGTSTTSSY
jgi:hypothetical protein